MDGSSSVSASDVDLRTVLDRMADGVFAVDNDWHITYANETARELLESAMTDDALDDAAGIDGLHFWESIPEAVDTTFYDRYHEAMAAQEPVSFEEYYAPLGVWFDVRVFPSESGLSVYLRDITEQRRLEQQRQESLRALQELYAVSSDRDRTFEEKIESILERGTEYLDVENGFLTRIAQDTQHIEVSVATRPGLQTGESCPLEEAYCRRTIELDHLLTVVNAADEGWQEDPAYDRFDLGTYIGGRVTVDGELYGTLCFADTDAREEAFTDTQRTFVELLTRWVSYELERQQARSQLQRERDRLEEFASVVSHDLRNPLQTAVGRVELLSEATDNEHVPPLERALSRMESLIEDLLTLARDGMQVEAPEDVDVATLADEAWRTTDSAAASLRVEPDRLLLRADRSRFRQLLENLFRNSVEHGGDDVTVTVGALPDGRGFYVADDGPGIPPAEREAVFDAGYTSSESGTGFGLSIVKQIAEAHGWTVSVTDADDGGARFEVTGVEVVGE
ncbi:ATP-binding protein [Halobellus ruber]|uniref:histidine kinase n=1 Tax=Halobellus ruber TaxID=2761102 RepID=A0A7J9SLJ4_9EURY|nr:ATP-binding protein [Halobellus ruber]MBB6646877.1 PAS domain-containing protein [Halobellus ruber]